MDTGMNLSEPIDTFDLSEGMDEGDGKKLASEEHLYHLDEPEKGSTTDDMHVQLPKNVINADGIDASLGNVFAEPQNESWQYYQEYQKQVELEILYQTAMIAHLQAQQISKRAQAAFSYISTNELQVKEQQQQETNWHLERHQSSQTEETHYSQPSIKQTQDITSYPTLGKELYAKHQEREFKQPEWNQHSPKGKQEKTASVLCMESLQEGQFALSFSDQVSELQALHSRCFTSKVSEEKSTKSINQLQKDRQKQNNSCTEMNKGSYAKLNLEQQFRDKRNLKSNKEVWVDLQIPLLKECVEQSDEEFQETYTEEILQLLLQDDLDDNGPSLEANEMKNNYCT